MNKLIDSEELVSALQVWFQPGDVFELRVLDAVTRAYCRAHVESGYFDYDHIAEIPAAIDHIKAAKGFYVTVNPVAPELLNRAVNRVRPSGREPTTSDGDVLLRRWLLIDCDAKRASGIPSSNAEHDLAYKKAIEIRDGFASMGWSDPIITDSGNGAQLMYRIDLPAADNELVHNVLKSVAAVSSDAVDIDVTVHNPARIWRLPGTMNCKGDSTAERPHRMARLLSVPDNLSVITEEQLRAACPVQTATAPAVAEVHSDFDLDRWIAEHCTGIHGPEQWKDGRKWVFDVCPFNPDHTNHSAVITQQSNGAIGFTCHHNGCKDKDWKALRELLEPNRDIARSHEYADVDLSAFFESIRKKKARKENPFEDPGHMPADLLFVPGLVNEIVEIDLATAPYPNRILAFAGALSMVAHLAGRKMRDKRNNFTNIYLIALANSGTGKDHPRKVNAAIGVSVSMQSTIADSFASGAGLEDSMFSTPAQLFQMDEVDWLFNTLKGAKDAAISESINEKLLKFYSSSNSIYSIRKKAHSKNGKADNSYIANPCLNLFGTAVPDYFYESLSRRVLENGLVARCLIVEADKRGKHGNPGVITSMLSADFLDRVQHLASMPTNESLLGVPDPYEIPETEEASALLEQYCDACDNRYDGYEKLHDLTAMALWARAMEKVYKLSMIYAISQSPRNPIVDVDAVKWAFQFVSFVSRRMLFRAGQFCYESKSDQLQKRFMKILHETGGTMSHSDIMRRLHLTKREMQEVSDSLLDAEQIIKEYPAGSTGKTKAIYVEVL